MLVVVVDSATPAVTVALARVEESGVTVLAERVTVDARAHGELLAPAVAAVLAEAGVKPASLGAVVAGVGPGPFTGLRVGLVTAVALCQALGIPAYGVCSLDALIPLGPLGGGVPHSARSGLITSRGTPPPNGDVVTPARSGLVISGGTPPPSGDLVTPARSGLVVSGGTLPPGGGGVVLVATDARRREVYWAVYADGVRISGPSVDRPAEAAIKAAPYHPTLAVGDGAVRYADVLGLPVLETVRYPDAGVLAALAADRVRSHAPGEPLTPLYLRRPDAVAAAGGGKTTLQ